MPNRRERRAAAAAFMRDVRKGRPVIWKPRDIPPEVLETRRQQAQDLKPGDSLDVVALSPVQALEFYGIPGVLDLEYSWSVTEINSGTKTLARYLPGAKEYRLTKC